MNVTWLDIANNNESIDLAIEVLSLNPDNKFLFSEFLNKCKEFNLNSTDSFKFICVMIHLFGGIQIYLPKEASFKKLVVYKMIYSEFNGRNTVELAEKYSMSKQAVYRIVKACTKAEVDARKSISGSV
ncbi:Mor transcription activator family protein [Vibrio parahaemolyticus]|uniref:Mor transcription activator family protein n=1 Tax=Vibrio parahaemolyticus TaxID=670 RepID=UPI002B1FF0C5|nr:Mor transcription activator family protein [Vibrio parahaemolyticus]MEA5313393.1 Mor transcription activator family protein [Vibrio parahaemolyticus]